MYYADDHGHRVLTGTRLVLKVAYNNNPEGALIQFASPEEAKRAMQSTEAVLNNRFIKVFWHREDAVEHAHPTPPVVRKCAYCQINDTQTWSENDMLSFLR